MQEGAGAVILHTTTPVSARTAALRVSAAALCSRCCGALVADTSSDVLGARRGVCTAGNAPGELCRRARERAGDPARWLAARATGLHRRRGPGAVHRLGGGAWAVRRRRAVRRRARGARRARQADGRPRPPRVCAQRRRARATPSAQPAQRFRRAAGRAAARTARVGGSGARAGGARLAGAAEGARRRAAVRRGAFHGSTLRRLARLTPTRALARTEPQTEA